MRIVFFGTPQAAATCLSALVDDGQDVALVVTRPDRPRGRGRRLAEPPVKTWACEAGLAVLQPESVNDDACLRILREAAAGLFVVVAFGQIFRQPLLVVPPRGCVNVHFSLLPRYRGAAPVQYALLNGEEETGVTTMYMGAGLDTGDTIFQECCAIRPDDTTPSLMSRLAEQGAALLVRTVRAIEEGNAPRTPQLPEEVSLAPVIQAEQGVIRWDSAPRRLCCLARALAEAPGCAAWIKGKRVRIWALRALTRHSRVIAAPGTVLEVTREGLLVACGDGQVLVTELQPEGGSRMAAHAFANGYRIVAGDRFEPPATG
jgi:methionyl-tRNA formyltransferase